MADDLPLPTDELLRQTEWLRALACSLANDAATADDAAQESWLAALRRPPRDPRSLPGYLAVALHRALAMMRRGNRRRAARERAVALPANAAAEPAADLVARFELHRLLVALVLALPEPQRELVLRHYFEGEEVAALSRRLSLSADAVRGHLRRARSALRKKLADGDERVRRGFALVVGMAGPPLLPIVTALGVSMKWKLTAAAAVLVGGLFAWQMLSPTNTATPIAAARTLPAASAATLESERPTGTQRSEVAATLTRTVHCKLVGLRPEVPWTAAVQIEFAGALPNERREDAQRANPAADGTFDLHLPAWIEDCGAFAARLRASDPFYSDVDVTESSPTLARSALVASDVYEIQVQVVALITGKVVDSRGEPVGGARIDGYPMDAGAVMAAPPMAQTHSLANGTFALQVHAALPLAVLAVPLRPSAATDGELRDDLLAGWVKVESILGQRVVAPTLTLGEPAVIDGTIQYADGTPVRGARIYIIADPPADAGEQGGSRSYWSDGRAAFLSPVASDAHGTFHFAAVRDKPLWWWVANIEGMRFPGFINGRLTAPGRLKILMDGVRTSVRVSCAGQPVANVVIIPEDPQNYGGRTGSDGVFRFLRAPALAQRLSISREGESAHLATVPADQQEDVPFLVDLPPIATAAVRLQLVSDRPVRKAYVELWPADASAAKVKRDLVRDDVTQPFVLALPPQQYELHVYQAHDAEGDDTFLLDAHQQIAVPAEGIDVVMPVRHGGRLTAVAFDSRGVPVAGGVRIIGPDNPVEPPCFTGHLGTDGPMGTGTIAPGRYVFMLNLYGQGIHRRLVDVKPYEVAEVKIDLP